MLDAEGTANRRVGAGDDFFDLGGHSLLATQVISRLRDAHGVELEVRALFEHPTVEALAASLPAPANREGSMAPPITPRRRDDDPGASFAQERLWFLDQMTPGDMTYNMPAAVRLTGRLDTAALAAALAAIVRRHEVLRTTFAVRGSDLVQVVASPPTPSRELPRINLRSLAAARRGQEAHRLAYAEARRPFDLSRGPLARITLLALGEREHVLLLNFHHVVFDGWSTAIFLRELSLFYRAAVEGEPARPQPLPVQYADFSEWQRRWLSGGELERQTEYWRRQWAARRGDRPAARPTPAGGARPAGRQPFCGPAGRPGRGVAPAGPGELGDALHGSHGRLHDRAAASERPAGRPRGLTGRRTQPLADRAPDRLLRQHLGDPRPGRGRHRLPWLPRSDPGHDARSLCPPGPAVREARRRARAEAQPQSLTDLPGHGLAPERLQPAPVPARLEPKLLEDEVTTTKFDLTLGFMESAKRLVAQMGYRTELFDSVTLKRLRGHFVNLLESVTADPDRALGELESIGATERHQVLIEWNATADGNTAGHLHHLFGRQVGQRPDAVALVSDGDVESRWSYGALGRWVGNLARHMARRGVGPETRVGLCLERSPEAVAALLAVQTAGGAYVPLDPSYPGERLAFMLADSRAALLISRRGQLPEGVGLAEEILWLDALRPEGTPAGSAGILPALRPEGTPENLAYVIYTSGSTGRPKGVAVPHRGVTNTLAAAREIFHTTPGSRCLQAASLSFDASVLEIGNALTSGATLYMARRETLLSDAVGTLARWRITAMPVVPSFLATLGEAELPALEALTIGGEAAPGDLAARWARRCRLFNVYAPTELSIFNTSFAIPADGTVFAGSPPVGRPIRGNRVYLLDRAGRPVPVGVAGELCGGGAGIVRGYLGRPALTAERFIPDPHAGDAFSGTLGERLYRTGDLARCRHGGEIEFLGRTDHQVKVRGVRIELGEIETALSACPGVHQAVVATRGDLPGGFGLVGYVVAAGELEIPALRERLKDRLPEAMVPSTFVVLDELPMTPTGKVDRAALGRRELPSPDSGRDVTAEYVAPRNDLEERLAELWSSILGHERIGVDDDFFELGGNSLQAALLMRRLQNALGEIVYVAALFDAPTLGGLAHHLEQTHPEAVERWCASQDTSTTEPRCLIGLQPGQDSHVPLAIVHPVFGEVQMFRHLAAALGAERPVYGLRAIGLEAGEEAADDIAAMAERYLEEVTTRWPRGPYALAGSSMGGAVAWEMARRLRQRGETVALLAFLDTADPHYAPPLVGDLEVQAAMLEYLANGNFEAALTRLRQADSDDERADALLDAGRASGRAPASADREWLRRVLTLVRRHGDALRAYRPETYDGELVHIRAAMSAERFEHPEVSGWAELCRSVEVTIVPGDHLSIHFPPQVQALAEILRPALERADRLVVRQTSKAILADRKGRPVA